MVGGMQQIADWLKNLGMSEYAQIFADNDIDFSVLRHLTDQHLKDLGVSLGHRLKMLHAIGELEHASVVANQPSAGTKPVSHDVAERRQLTVMLCDLVGSTALSTRLDPEDLRGIIGAYRRCCTELVEGNGGFVAKYMGDGVLAYFGYPRAHEHDAERAVRAGLGLVEAVPKLETVAAVPLHVRVGIATGLVVVGDLIGAGAAQEQAVVGETPNLAARLQALAEPGAVVIAGSTRKLIGGLFEYRDLGSVALKGFAENVPAWQVLGASAAESRFEALRATTTPLVGREEEIDLLMRRWEQAKRGGGCVVLISGEPGIGKSRIAQSVLERLGDELHTRLRYFCSPHHQDSALYPSIAQLERAAGFRRDDTDEQRLNKLETVLAQGTNDLSEAVPLLADLLSIPTANRYPPLNLTPQKRKEKTLHAQLEQVEGLAAQQPVLMVWEDVHWSDPTTRESLDLLVDRVSTLRVLAVITFRPEFTPPWLGRRHVTLFSLTRLPPRQRTEMIVHLTGGKVLPREILEQVIERTDGVPLFVEELTKAVIESGILADAGDHYVVTGSAMHMAIPATLQASLMARLDRLGPVREVAQIGAAIGRQFSHELISAVAPIPQRRLNDALDQLVEAELIYRRGTPSQAEYTFKHALVQDAAYSTLLRSRRQQLHSGIVAVVESRFPEIAAGEPARLAQHCGEAALNEKAIGYWRKAGEQAVRRAGNLEAIEHFRRAIALLASQPDTVERARAELASLIELGPALMSVYGWPSQEAGEAFERAGEIARRLESSADLAPPLTGLWLSYVTRGQFDRAEGISGEMFRIARELGNPEILLQAYHASFPLRWLRGRFPAAREHIEAGMQLYDEQRHERHRYLYMVHDPAVCALSIEAPVQWLLGYPHQATRVEGEAIELARRLRHAPSLAHGLWFAGEAQVLRDDVAAVAATASELLELCEEHKLPHVRATGLMFRGWALARCGEVAEGARFLEEGFAVWDRVGGSVYRPRGLCLLAEAHLLAGRYVDGLEDLARAFTIVEQTGEQWAVARMHQLRAELLLRAHDRDDEAVEASLRTAIEVAQVQGARSWELKAAISLARLLAERSKRLEARNLLQPIFGWFTEGFDTPVLQDAKALLDELA
jgi:class 3 adenylate cyclase/predicted ATPase